MPLTEDQVDFYSRQIILRELGGRGQLRLLETRCLARGAGPGLEAALTYLAGGGIGSIDVDRTAPPGLAFAPLEDRNPDVVLGDADATADPGRYDVFLDFTARPSFAPAGRARLGEIGVAAHTGSTVLRVVPSAAGCLSCHFEGTQEASVGDTIALAQAGVLAALQALCWGAGIDAGERARLLRLDDGAASWVTTMLGPTVRCPRPCRA